MKTKMIVLTLIAIVIFSGIAIAENASPVKVVQVDSKTIKVEQIVNGVIEPIKNIMISSKTGGILENVNVKIGQFVSLDDILIVLEKDQIFAQIAQAEAALEMSLANLALVEKGASEEDLKLAQSSLDQAKVSYQAALTNLKYALSMYDDRTMQKQQLLGSKTQVKVAEKQLQMAEERYLQAKIAFELTEADYSRMTTLLKEEAITQKQFEGIESQYKNALSAFNSAKLAKEQAQVSYQGTLESYHLAQQIFENRTSAEQQIDAAKTQIDVASANMNIAQANFAKLVNGASIEQIRVTQASVKQAEAALSLVRLQLGNCVIVSPIDGVVAQVNGDPGEMIGPGTPILTIIDIDQVYVKANVTADVLRFLQVGDRVKIKVRAYPEDSQEGQIELISPMADLLTQAFPIKVLLKNDELKFKPGMFANLVLTLEKSTDTTVIPIEAVLNLEKDPYVYVVNSTEKKYAEKRNITIGLVTDNEVEVISGINVDELVVINGHHTLKDGDQVEVID